jgi:tetratricopeptide (TPR) repeat protein
VKALFSFLAVVVVLAAATGTPGQTSAPTAGPASPWLSDSDRVQFEQLREAGFEALYNLEYGKAHQNFAEIQKLFPQHPGGSQYLASGLWIETLHKSRRLQSSLYNSKSFYANGDEKVDAKVIEQFRTLTRTAKKLSEARLKQYPKDIEALYFLGCTEGLKASFEEAVERRHFAALKDGSDAVDHHRQIIKIDPGYHDAEVTIGLYDYILGSMPLPAKIIAGITGARGSKKRGLATVERVMNEGRSARDQARTLLIVLYTREKRYSDAAAVARELVARYPRNYVYRLEAADALVMLAFSSPASKGPISKGMGDTTVAVGAAEEAFAIFEALLHDKIVADTASRAFDLIHFEYGEALLRAGKFERAAEEFVAATKVEGADQCLSTMAHLFAGRALDAGNKREQALAEYHVVLSRPDVFEAHDEANKRLRDPFKADAARMNLR